MSTADNLLAENCEEPAYPDQYPYFCEEVAPVIFDQENTVTELDSNSSGTVSITEGNEKYIWMVTGNGFYFDEGGTQTTLHTANPSVTIYTIDACGAGKITVDNGCNKAAVYIRLSNGTWVTIPSSKCALATDDSRTIVKGKDAVTRYGCTPWHSEHYWFSRIEGRYKYLIDWNWAFHIGESQGWFDCEDYDLWPTVCKAGCSGQYRKPDKATDWCQYMDGYVRYNMEVGVCGGTGHEGRAQGIISSEIREWRCP